MYFNNRMYAIFSFILAVTIARSVVLESHGETLGEQCAYIYHLSKFYEYLDVLLLVAQGIAIGKHMAFHHMTVSHQSAVQSYLHAITTSYRHRS